MADYTGDVEVGGPTHVRTLQHLVIRKIAVSEMSNNAYLLTCRGSGEQLLIDAADDAARHSEAARHGRTDVGRYRDEHNGRH